VLNGMWLVRNEFGEGV